MAAATGNIQISKSKSAWGLDMIRLLVCTAVLFGFVYYAPTTVLKIGEAANKIQLEYQRGQMENLAFTLEATGRSFETFHECTRDLEPGNIARFVASEDGFNIEYQVVGKEVAPTPDPQGDCE